MMKHFIPALLLLISVTATAQQQIVYNSKNLAKPDTTWVFTPAGAKSTDQLPLVFLLHGYGGTYKQWNSIMNAQQYADNYGFIIVCPDGLYNSWYLNSPGIANSRFESFFYDELWPDIMKKFKPAADKVFISGLSMGGHGALTLFLKHPERFKSAGSTSGVTDLNGLTKKYELSALMGNVADDSPVWNAFSVIGNIEQLKGTDKAIIFDCGVDDPFYTMNNQLKAKCDELKIKATYISQPGTHNRAYWTGSIRQHFNFFKAQLN